MERETWERGRTGGREGRRERRVGGERRAGDNEAEQRVTERGRHREQRVTERGRHREEEEKRR